MKLEMTVKLMLDMPERTPEAIWQALVLSNDLKTLRFGVLNPKGKAWETSVTAHSYETVSVEKL